MTEGWTSSLILQILLIFLTFSDHGLMEINYSKQNVNFLWKTCTGYYNKVIKII